MTTLQLCIDARPARQGAREFARCAEDIRRAAVTVTQAVESLDTAVSNADGAFDRLGRSLLDLRDPLGESGLIDVATGITNDIRLALNNPIIRDELVSLANSLQSTLSKALSEAANKDSKVLDGLLDSLAEQLNEFGPALGLLGPKGAAIVQSLEAGIPVVRLLSGAVRQMSREMQAAEPLLLSFQAANAEIPRLRQDLAEASGKRREVIAQQLADRETQVLASVGNFLDSVVLVLRREVAATDNPGKLLGGEFEQAMGLLTLMFRRSNVPEAREFIRSVLGEDRRPLPPEFDRLEEFPLLPKDGGADPFAQEGLLIRPGLTPNNAALMPQLTRASFAAAPHLGDDQFAIDGIIEANRTITEGLELNIQSSRDFADGAEAAFRSYAASATDAAGQAESLVIDGMKGMENALVGFVQTGKIEFRSLIDSLVADLLRLVIRTQVLGPLAQALGSAFGPSDPFAGGTGPAPGSFRAAQTIGMAHGGSFVVPGSGGVDSVVPIFRATPGERVTVTPPGRGAGGSVVNVNVINEAGAQVDVRETANGQGGVDIEVLIARAVERDIAGGGRVARAIAQNFGARPVAIGR